MNEDKLGDGIKGRLVGVEPLDEAEHWDVCPLCGQAFDMRDLGQVMRHANPDHKPARLDA